MDFHSLGYFGLFCSSFLSATILPFSSELILVYFLTHSFSPAICFLVASSGNSAGGALNYWMGYFGKKWWFDKVKYSLTDDKIKKYQKYGSYLAFFSWVPIVGDPFLLGLGFLKTSPSKTMFWMILGKLMRYFILIYFLTYFN